MPNALRTRTRMNSETLHLPELRDLIGKDVEIIVAEQAAAGVPSGSNGEPARREGADWRTRFDAMLAEAGAAQRQAGAMSPPHPPPKLIMPHVVT